MRLVSAYTWGWIAWLLAFAVLEGAALARRKPGDTLSEHVWAWFCIKGGGRFALARRVTLAAFLGWLAWHFLAP